MRRVIRTDAAALGRDAAEFIAAEAERAIDARGRFTLALSGGRSPAPLFEALAASPLAWRHVHLLQVDERMAADEPEARNASLLDPLLLDRVPLPPTQVHMMPAGSRDFPAAAARYSGILAKATGGTRRLDLVHLGLGADGHTASLFPDDAALGQEADVVVSGRQAGYVRLSLSLGTINRARRRLWFVTGHDKREALGRLLAGDTDSPAGRVARENAIVFATADAGAGN